MVVPLFAARKCTWPQFSHKSQWFLAKKLFCHFQQFPNAKSCGLGQKRPFRIYPTCAYYGFLGSWKDRVFFLQISASQWYPIILYSEFSFRILSVKISLCNLNIWGLFFRSNSRSWGIICHLEPLNLLKRHSSEVKDQRQRRREGKQTKCLKPRFLLFWAPILSL